MDVIFILFCVLLTKANSCTSAQSGPPQFNLFCKQNNTTIHFPNYGDLVVKSISYDTRRLNLVDPKNCVHEVFLNLNLSGTPFSYYYVVRQYKYINCSTQLLVGPFEQVPCMSGSYHHVYVVEPSFPVPVYCSPVRTVAIPFSYSPYLSDNSFGLELTWNEKEAHSGCNFGFLCGIGPSEKYLRALWAVTCIIAFVFITKLLYASLSKYCNKFTEGNARKEFGVEETHKLIGVEYEAK